VERGGRPASPAAGATGHAPEAPRFGHLDAGPSGCGAGNALTRQVCPRLGRGDLPVGAGAVRLPRRIEREEPRAHPAATEVRLRRGPGHQHLRAEGRSGLPRAGRTAVSQILRAPVAAGRESGAGEGSRTPTPLRALGFESRSSASSDTPARPQHTLATVPSETARLAYAATLDATCPASAHAMTTSQGGTLQNISRAKAASAMTTSARVATALVHTGW
jgi:hypothetical protein